MSSSNGLFSDIGLEELSLPRAGLSVDNVETGASSDLGTSFRVEFAAAWYCNIGLETSVPFWDIWSEELTLLSGAFEPEVFFFDSEDEWNNKDCGDLAGMPVGISFESSTTTSFISSLVLFNGDTLLDDVWDAETGTAADLSNDTCCESEALCDVDLDAMFSFDTGFKLWPSFDLGGSIKIII